VLPVHPAAELFPLMSEAELRELGEDIKTNGLQVPITLLYTGTSPAGTSPERKDCTKYALLDGRNRLDAMELVGAQFKLVWKKGRSDWSWQLFSDEVALPVLPVESLLHCDEPVSHVISLNLKRRHLDESQRAMVAAKVATLGHGQRQSGKFAGVPTQQEMAALLNVSERSVRSAAEVRDHGAEELQHAVERGDVSVSAAAVIATESPAQQRALVARGEREILDAARSIRARKLSDRRKERIAKVAALADPGPLPRSQWPVLLADAAPQRYEEISDTAGRAIQWQYPTLSLEQLCALPVRDIVAPSAVLFFWTPATLQFQAPAILEAWGGFRIRSELVWVKTGGPGLHAIGPGTYVRYEHEHLLIATRGDMPTPPENARPPSVLYAPRREHSRKPDEAYELIERMYPELPKIELFARARRPGWDAWGNEVLPPGQSWDEIWARPFDHTPDPASPTGPPLPNSELPPAAGANTENPATHDGLDIPEFLRRSQPEVRP
jgi:N6-adenosine-specific RNA methylase IME4